MKLYKEDVLVRLNTPTMAIELALSENSLDESVALRDVK